jgi:hypothetical protein
MALITKILIFLFKKNYYLAQSYIITQGIRHPRIPEYLKI